MKQDVQFHDKGLIAYADSLTLQECFYNYNQEQKKADKPEDTTSHLIFCEHPHVYTLGKSGNATNLLIPDELLKKIGATYFHIDRGGDITYHGPGQLVGYPIFDLDKFGYMVRRYIHNLEESVIQLIAEYGISGGRTEGATGVWLAATDTQPERKICAIGVKVGRGITMHGFALNVNTNLDYFRYINPCGFIDKGVTTMAKELGQTVDMDEVKNRLKNIIANVFEYNYNQPD